MLSNVRSRYIQPLLVTGDTGRCVDALYDTQEGDKDMQAGNVGEKYQNTKWDLCK